MRFELLLLVAAAAANAIPIDFDCHAFISEIRGIDTFGRSHRHASSFVKIALPSECVDIRMPKTDLANYALMVIEAPIGSNSDMPLVRAYIDCGVDSVPCRWARTNKPDEVSVLLNASQTRPAYHPYFVISAQNKVENYTTDFVLRKRSVGQAWTTIQSTHADTYHVYVLMRFDDYGARQKMAAKYTTGLILDMHGRAIRRPSVELKAISQHIQDIAVFVDARVHRRRNRQTTTSLEALSAMFNRHVLIYATPSASRCFAIPVARVAYRKFRKEAARTAMPIWEATDDAPTPGASNRCRGDGRRLELILDNPRDLRRYSRNGNNNETLEEASDGSFLKWYEDHKDVLDSSLEITTENMGIFLDRLLAKSADLEIG
ncbi:unnamed protein product [Caenorhabditis bovis]|nr:unnamed protein product [Caenorhabditis bovis]